LSNFCIYNTLIIVTTMLVSVATQPWHDVFVVAFNNKPSIYYSVYTGTIPFSISILCSLWLLLQTL